MFVTKRVHPQELSRLNTSTPHANAGCQLDNYEFDINIS